MESSSTGAGAGNVKKSEECNSGGVMVKKVKRERGLGSTAKERISKMAPCTAGKRSSIYRGVTRHRWTGRYEAHLWDKTTWNLNQNKKGKQVYLGAYDEEEGAARAYDLAALKYWGPATLINFPVSDYSRDLHEMQNVSREEYLASLRRKSSGFSRGIAKYRSLSSGRWDSSLTRPPPPEYLHPAGDDVPAEGGGFTMEPNIDLTPHIKWWGTHKIRQSHLKHPTIEDLGMDLKSIQTPTQSTQPYQMPELGTCFEANKTGKPSTTSASTILSKSAAFKNMQQRINQNHDKENNKIDNTIVSTLGLPLHNTAFNLDPLLTNYNALDHLPDPILWTSFMPALPVPPPPPMSQVTKTESSSTYSFFMQEGQRH